MISNIIRNKNISLTNKPIQMKKFSIILIAVFAGLVSLAQTATPAAAQTTIDIPDYYKKQADSMKTLYESRGFQLLRANFISMESSYEYPIILPMEAGTWYQFVFIGDNTNHLNEVRCFDWEEKMVFYEKKKWADVDGNILDIPYIAKQTEYHMIKPVQENKKKKWLAGGVMLFKKNGSSPNAPQSADSAKTTPASNTPAQTPTPAPANTGSTSPNALALLTKNK
jgi:hypothetical protein